MPWVGSVMEQRLALVWMVEAGSVSVAEACRRFGVSRPTGYKWLARYRAEGAGGLVDRSRRPYSSPGRTDPAVEELVVAVRERFPTWGGRKIRAFLLRQGHTPPAASTITTILVRHGLLVPIEPVQRQFGSFEAAAPNAMWQIDFKGHFGLGNGQRCHPLGILDDHSRFNLCLQACTDQRAPTVQAHLIDTFDAYGLPDVILADNGPPWGSTNPTYRWTGLRVWLADLDVAVVHSTPRHPQTLGKQERFHLTLAQELLWPTPGWANPHHIQEAFDTWRTIYNQHRPHQGIGDAVPADRYRSSDRALPTYITPPTYPDHWIVRTVAADARIHLTGQRHKIGKPFIGKPIGIDPQTNIAHYRTHPIRPVNHVPEHP